MQGPDYKNKYKELRAKYMNNVDLAFRIGFEQGVQQAQQQQALDAQAQANAEKQQMQNGMQPGSDPQDPSATAPSEPGQENPSAPPVSPEQAGGSELDQHIGKLESMLGSDSSPEVQKSLHAIISLRKSEKDAAEMKKSQIAIAGIAKALHKPVFKIGVQASHNLTDNAKKAVSMQSKIVNDVMKSWEAQENKAKNSLESILNIEGLIKE